jgi:hypothetical protein
MKTFEQLLDVREFTALYRAVDSIQDYPFTKTFYQNPRNVESDSVEMISLSGITRPAPGNVRNGTARVLSPRGGTRKEATLFRIFNEVVAPGDALKALREPESFAMQDKGRQVIDLANEEMALRNRMHKEVVFSQILTNGRVNLDANGEILVPSVNATSGAITDAGNSLISADFGIANNHRGNLGGLVSALWSVAGTKISDQLEAIRYDALKHGAPAPTEIYVHRLSKKFLRANTEFNDWAKFCSDRAVDAVLRGDVIENLWGFNWHFIDGTWTDVTGTIRDLIPQTQAVIVPRPGPWLRPLQGSELVPGEIGYAPTWQSALAHIRKVYGEFAYSMVKHNPVALEFFYGDNFGLHFADVNCIYMPTVFSS